MSFLKKWFVDREVLIEAAALLTAGVTNLMGELQKMNQTIERVLADVQQCRTVVSGVHSLCVGNAVLIRQLKAQLQAAIDAGQPVDLSPLDQAAADLEAITQEAQQAIIDGTVAEDAPNELPAPNPGTENPLPDAPTE